MSEQDHGFSDLESSRQKVLTDLDRLVAQQRSMAQIGVFAPFLLLGEDYDLQDAVAIFRDSQLFLQLADMSVEGSRQSDRLARFRSDLAGAASSQVAYGITAATESREGNTVLSGNATLEICKDVYPNARERKGTFGNTSLEGGSNPLPYTPDGLVVDPDGKITGVVEYKLGNKRLSRQKGRFDGFVERLRLLGLCSESVGFIVVTPRMRRELADVDHRRLRFDRDDFYTAFVDPLFNEPISDSSQVSRRNLKQYPRRRQ